MQQMFEQLPEDSLSGRLAKIVQQDMKQIFGPEIPGMNVDFTVKAEGKDTAYLSAGSVKVTICLVNIVKEFSPMVHSKQGKGVEFETHFAFTDNLVKAIDDDPALKRELRERATRLYSRAFLRSKMDFFIPTVERGPIAEEIEEVIAQMAENGDIGQLDIAYELSNSETEEPAQLYLMQAQQRALEEVIVRAINSRVLNKDDDFHEEFDGYDSNLNYLFNDAVPEVSELLENVGNFVTHSGEMDKSGLDRMYREYMDRLYKKAKQIIADFYYFPDEQQLLAEDIAKGLKHQAERLFGPDIPLPKVNFSFFPNKETGGVYSNGEVRLGVSLQGALIGFMVDLFKIDKPRFERIDRSLAKILTEMNVPSDLKALSLASRDSLNSSQEDEYVYRLASLISVTPELMQKMVDDLELTYTHELLHRAFESDDKVSVEYDRVYDLFDVPELSDPVKIAKNLMVTGEEALAREYLLRAMTRALEENLVRAADSLLVREDEYGRDIESYQKSYFFSDVVPTIDAFKGMIDQFCNKESLDLGRLKEFFKSAKLPLSGEVERLIQVFKTEIQNGNLN
jgi:hypothetical protein